LTCVKALGLCCPATERCWSAPNKCRRTSAPRSPRPGRGRLGTWPRTDRRWGRARPTPTAGSPVQRAPQAQPTARP